MLFAKQIWASFVVFVFLIKTLQLLSEAHALDPKHLQLGELVSLTVWCVRSVSEEDTERSDTSYN